MAGMRYQVFIDVVAKTGDLTLLEKKIAQMRAALSTGKLQLKMDPAQLQQYNQILNALEATYQKVSTSKSRNISVSKQLEKALKNEGVDLKLNKKSLDSLIASANKLTATETRATAVKQKNTAEQKKHKASIDATTASLKRQTDQYGGFISAAGRYHTASGKFGQRPVDSNIPMAAPVPVASPGPGRPQQGVGQEAYRTGRHAMIAAPVYGAIYGGMALIQRSIQQFIEFDKTLNRIGIVSGTSAESLKTFAKQASAVGRELSITAKEYADAALIFYQQGGRALDYATQLAKASVQMSNVLGLSQQDSSDALTAIMNSFELLADSGEKAGEHIADVIVKLDQTTASSGAEISDGLKRFASVAKAAGLTYEEAASMFATVSSATRLSAESIGTGFKTFLTRLQEVREAGPNAVEDFTSKLAKVAKNFNLNIQVFDETGELRAGKELLDQVAASYATLTSNTEKQALIQAIAGKHQINIVQSLMDNWDVYQSTLEAAQHSQGAADAAQLKYNTSLIAAVGRLKNSWEEFMHTLITSDELRDIIDFLETVVNLLTSAVSGQGLVLTIMEIIGLIVILTTGIKKFGATSAAVTNEKAVRLQRLKLLYDANRISLVEYELRLKKLGITSATVMGQMMAGAKKMGLAIKASAGQIGAMAGQMLMLTQAINLYSNATNKSISSAEKANSIYKNVAFLGVGLALQAAALPPPAGVALMIAGFAMAGIGGIGYLATKDSANRAKEDREHQKLVAQQLNKQGAKYAENQINIQRNVTTIETLEKKSVLTETETEELRRAREAVTSIMPELTEYEDEYGNKIQRTTQEIKEQIAQQEKLLRIRRASAAVEQQEQVEKDYAAAKAAVERGPSEEELALNRQGKLSARQAQISLEEAGGSFRGIEFDEETQKFNSRVEEFEKKLAAIKGTGRTQTASKNYYKSLIEAAKDQESIIENLNAGIESTARAQVAVAEANQQLFEEQTKQMVDNLISRNVAIGDSVEKVEAFRDTVLTLGLSFEQVEEKIKDAVFLKSLENIYTLQSNVKDVHKELKDLASSNEASVDSLTNKQKELEFATMKAAAAQAALRADDIKALEEIMAGYQEYTEEGLKDLTNQFIAFGGDLDAIGKTTLAQLETFYQGMVNIFAKKTMVDQLNDIKEAFNTMGISDSVIENLRAKGFTMVQIFAATLKAMRDQANADTELTGLVGRYFDKSALEKIKAKYPNLNISASMDPNLSSPAFGGFNITPNIESYIPKPTTPTVREKEPAKMATGGDPYAGTEFLIKQYDLQIELLKKEEQTLETLADLANKTKQKATQLSNIINISNKEKEKALKTLGISPNASPEQIAAEINRINAQIASGGMTEESAALLRGAISDYTGALDKANNATKDFKETLKSLADSFSSFDFLGIDELLKTNNALVESSKKYQDFMLTGAEKTLEFSKLGASIKDALSETADTYSRDKLLEYEKELNTLMASGADVSDARVKFLSQQVNIIKERIRLEKQSNAENRLMLVRDAGGGFTYQFRRTTDPNAPKMPTAKETDTVLAAATQKFVEEGSQAFNTLMSALGPELKTVLGDSFNTVVTNITSNGMSIDQALKDINLTQAQKDQIKNSLTVLQSSYTSFGDGLKKLESFQNKIDGFSLGTLQTQFDSAKKIMQEVFGPDMTSVTTALEKFAKNFDVDDSKSPAGRFAKALKDMADSAGKIMPSSKDNKKSPVKSEPSQGTTDKSEAKKKPPVATLKFIGDKSKLSSTSIVDYLKFKDYDSSFAARKSLYDFYYDDSYTGSADQNVKLLKKLQADGYSTGGYTGDSPGPRPAILHEKELVLNKMDTKNILSAVMQTRSLPQYSAMGPAGALPGAGGSGQNVIINASFPNVSSADEIKRAFASMSNNALQFNTRNKVIGAGIR